VITEQLKQFFNDYALAITHMDLSKIKQCFTMPFIVVHKEPEGVVSFDQELERKLKTFLISLKDKGIAGLKSRISSALDVSDHMTFVNVDWALYDENEQIIKSLSHSYIVSSSENNISIVTLIVDDNSDLFMAFLK
tara:strand:+ start:57 stop:464 length:408 start_codon:yes stop_codon:yes gene_type:complete